MHLSGRQYPGYSQQFPKTTTALQISASFGLESITQELLRRGATVLAKDEKRWTALHRASENGNQRIVELLLNNGLNIDSLVKHGGTALHRATKNGHEQLLRFLIDRKAAIHIEDQYGGTALHRAAKTDTEGLYICCLTVVLILIGSITQKLCRDCLMRKNPNFVVPVRLIVWFGRVCLQPWAFLSKLRSRLRNFMVGWPYMKLLIRCHSAFNQKVGSC